MLETSASFLPHWPPALPAVAQLALLLIAALVAGELAARTLKLPRIIGQVAVGVLLGPQAIGFVDAASLDALAPLIDLAIGLVLFELGGRIDFLWLKRNPWLLATSALEAALSFLLVFMLLRTAGVGALVAALCAAILMAASPEVITRITDEDSAQGQVTERLRLLTALNCAYAVFVLAVLRAWLNARYAHDALDIVLHPVYLLGASFLLAVVTTGLVHGVLRLVGPSPPTETLVLLAGVALLVAASDALAASSLVALLAFGALLHNSRPALARDFGPLGAALTLMLFAATGALLRFPAEGWVWTLAIGAVALRLAGKCTACVALAQPSGIGWRKGLWVGVGLAPLSALAIVMLERTVAGYPEIPPLLAGLTLACVALLQLVGPALTRLALRAARETGDPR